MGRGKGQISELPAEKGRFRRYSPVYDRDGLCAVPLLHGADGADALQGFGQ